MENEIEKTLGENIVDDEKLESATGGSRSKAAKLITQVPKHVCSNNPLGRLTGRYGTLVPSSAVSRDGKQLFTCSKCGMTGYIQFCADRRYCYLIATKTISNGPVEL